MLVKNIENPFSNEEINKTSLFSNYNKTTINFRIKPFKIKLNKAKKSKTVFINTDNLNNLKTKKNINNSNKTNSEYNSIINNHKDLTLTASKNLKPKTCSNFYHKKNNNLKFDDIIPNNHRIINIINYSKISSLYNTYNNSIATINSKPGLKIDIIKKINEFNSVEKYILKADKNIKEIKHEYRPNLEEFYINNQLRNYLKKSKNMIKAKDDLNKLYRDSHMLNNICDYVSNALFKLKTKKRNYIKNIKKELYQKKLEFAHKKMLDFKRKNMEIPEENLFKNKKFKTSDNIEIHPKIKAQMIYKSCYPYNSIKTLFDRNVHKNNLKLMQKNITNI